MTVTIWPTSSAFTRPQCYVAEASFQRLLLRKLCNRLGEILRRDTVTNSVTEAKALLATNLPAIHALVSDLIEDVSQVEWVLSSSLNKFVSTPDHFAKWAVNRCKEIHYLGVFMDKYYKLGADAIKVVKKLNQYDDHDVIDFFMYLCADPNRLEAVLHDEDGFPDEFEKRLRVAARRWATDVYWADRRFDNAHDPIVVKVRANEDHDIDTLAQASCAAWRNAENLGHNPPPLDDDDDESSPIPAPFKVKEIRTGKQADVLRLLFDLLRTGPMLLIDIRREAKTAGYGKDAIHTGIKHPAFEIVDKEVRLSENGLRMLDHAAMGQRRGRK
jgi:hypothetical protein